MKKEMNARMVIAVIAVLVVVVGFFGWRMFASNPGSGGDKLSPQQAGLGKPLYPAGQGQTPNNATPAGR